MRLPFYNPIAAATITRTGSALLRQVIRHNIEPTGPRRPGWLRMVWNRLISRFLPCPCCGGSRVEYFDLGGKIGRQIITCSMCDGTGRYRDYERIRLADIAAINAPARCGCIECFGEWER